MLATITQIPASLSPLASCDGNDQLIALWLHGKSPHSIKAYHRDIAYFLAFIEQKPLQEITLNDVQAFSTALAERGYSPATVRRRLCAIKSLLTFGHRIGALPVNAGAPVQTPKVKNTLCERILTEAQVLTMIALEPNRRNQILLRFMYATGCRVSELAPLKWGDVQESTDGAGQVTLFGKGGKTRFVKFSPDTWSLLQSFRGDAEPDEPIFQSRKGGHLDPRQVERIVEAAGKRANISSQVSPHWFRHSHASHALDRGVGIHLVQSTLGHASVATTGGYLHARPQDSSGLYLAV